MTCTLSRRKNAMETILDEAALQERREGKRKLSDAGMNSGSQPTLEEGWGTSREVPHKVYSRRKRQDHLIVYKRRQHHGLDAPRAVFDCANNHCRIFNQQGQATNAHDTNGQPVCGQNCGLAVYSRRRLKEEETRGVNRVSVFMGSYEPVYSRRRSEEEETRGVNRETSRNAVQKKGPLEEALAAAFEYAASIKEEVAMSSDLSFEEGAREGDGRRTAWAEKANRFKTEADNSPTGPTKLDTMEQGGIANRMRGIDGVLQERRAETGLQQATIASEEDEVARRRGDAENMSTADSGLNTFSLKRKRTTRQDRLARVGQGSRVAQPPRPSTVAQDGGALLAVVEAITADAAMRASVAYAAKAAITAIAEVVANAKITTSDRGRGSHSTSSFNSGIPVRACDLEDEVASAPTKKLPCRDDHHINVAGYESQSLKPEGSPAGVGSPGSAAPVSSQSVALNLQAALSLPLSPTGMGSLGSPPCARGPGQAQKLTNGTRSPPSPAGAFTPGSSVLVGSHRPSTELQGGALSPLSPPGAGSPGSPPLVRSRRIANRLQGGSVRVAPLRTRLFVDLSKQDILEDFKSISGSKSLPKRRKMQPPPVTVLCQNLAGADHLAVRYNAR
eukprot:TRINITY_DN3990_c1_g2_i1.p1 TRINITY_DN3990_c1_g2~~TRINITY_DN3990_c1_g2_i1.p1  ORF type:complete len:618 (+),score=79.21 TRINITY_DN3990_c1_g2_i1:914-2767(+)